jgi:lipopolysaccharide transport system ATP-binding protein
MSSDVVIRGEGLGKAFNISHQTSDSVTLAEAALTRLRHPLRRRVHETFWALRDISFEIERGSIVGLIGRNGSGKTTLLKILTGITPPTTGSTLLRGRVGSLLEVGTGFHQELTGRENIYLNGAILGMTRREIDHAFDSIVEFAGVSRFLDTPVKRYSTGMYVRLAFAVAAHLSSEILLVDEVLAVGDAAFNKRALGMMHDAATTGRTVVFVSHQMSAIAALCDSAFVLDRGELRFMGDTEEAIERYLASFTSPLGEGSAAGSVAGRAGGGEWRITTSKPSKTVFRVDEPKRIEFEARRITDHEIGAYAWANIVDESGNIVVRCDSRLSGVAIDPGIVDASFAITIQTPWFRPGRYFVDLYLENFGLYDGWERACTFEVQPVLPYKHTSVEDALVGGPVLADFEFELQPARAGAS